MRDQKNGMIAALWANSNYDDDKGTRRQAIEEIESNFEQVSDLIQHGEGRLEDEVTEMADNPFLAPAIRATRELEAPKHKEGTVRDNVPEVDWEIDQ